MDLKFIVYLGDVLIFCLHWLQENGEGNPPNADMLQSCDEVTIFVPDFIPKHASFDIAASCIDSFPFLF
jgi:hypothetical protein